MLILFLLLTYSTCVLYRTLSQSSARNTGLHISLSSHYHSLNSLHFSIIRRVSITNVFSVERHSFLESDSSHSRTALNELGFLTGKFETKSCFQLRCLNTARSDSSKQNYHFCLTLSTLFSLEFNSQDVFTVWSLSLVLLLVSSGVNTNSQTSVFLANSTFLIANVATVLYKKGDQTGWQ